MYTIESRELHKHLLAGGFMPGYTIWTSHGEDGMSCEGADHDKEQEWMMDGHAKQSDGDEYDESGEESMKLRRPKKTRQSSVENWQEWCMTNTCKVDCERD